AGRSRDQAGPSPPGRTGALAAEPIERHRTRTGVLKCPGFRPGPTRALCLRAAPEGRLVPTEWSERAARLFQEFDLLCRRHAAEDGVAMREAAEAFDDVAVGNRIARQLGVAQPGHQLDAARLLRTVLAVLERQVEKQTLVLAQLPEIAFADRRLRDA